ncbi:MAG: carboxylate-amine ligase [Pseudomonadota bacterium]
MTIPQTLTLGVEEEYLLVDLHSKDLAEAPEALMAALRDRLGKRVSPEFLRCQVEIGTHVCTSLAEARDALKRLRSAVAEEAARFGLAPIAASCHPFADWQDQHYTDKERYRALERDLATVARRLLICGMHVHVGIEDRALRIDLLNQIPYFLPHLLALSVSSPFWQGQDTGLASYRLTVFDNLPRTGLPPRFAGWEEFERSVEVIIRSGLIEDSSKIWWDVRPSARFPTLEARIFDVCPRLEHCLSLVALCQCIVRMLCRLRAGNRRWRIYDAFLVGENRWRAQRYGTSEGLIDFGRGEVVAFAELLDELIGLVAEDAEALGCTEEVIAARKILTEGTSAERQRRAYRAATDTGADAAAACRAVVSTLIDEFSVDL